MFFHLGSGGGTFKSRSGEEGCVADFITIPRGTNSLFGENSCIVSMVCEYCSFELFDIFSLLMVLQLQLQLQIQLQLSISSDIVGSDWIVL